jgi:hypothetical protein
VKQLVGGWWEEKVDLTPCNGATPPESRIREIRTYGSMRDGGRKTSSYSVWLGLVWFSVDAPAILHRNIKSLNLSIIIILFTLG